MDQIWVILYGLYDKTHNSEDTMKSHFRPRFLTDLNLFNISGNFIKTGYIF